MRKVLLRVNKGFTRVGLLVVGAATLAALAAGSGFGAGGAVTATSPDVIKGAFFRGSFPNLPEAVALDQGFFAKHNIEYQPITIAGGGAQQGAALAGGSIDFAPQEVRAIIVANARGGNFKMACGSFRSPIYDLVMRNSWPMSNTRGDYTSTMRQLKGAKIGISSLGSGTDFNISLLLRKSNLPEDHVTRVPIGGDPLVALAAMKAGQIDGFMSFEPATQLLLANGGKNVLAESKGVGPPVLRRYVTNGYTSLASNFEKRGDAYKRFCRAIADAVNFIENARNSKAVVSAFRGQTTGGQAIPDSIVAKAIANYHSTYHPIITPARYSLQVKMLYEFGFLRQSEKAPPFANVVEQSTQPTGYFVQRFTGKLTGAAKGDALVTLQGRKVCWTLGLRGGDRPTSAIISLGKAGRVVLALGAAYKAKGCTTASSRLVASIDDTPGSYYVRVASKKFPRGLAIAQLAV
jgi:NitT/TauT family transport system substrate-binding protein